jgi:ubiquinone/menaquinone biosynthesis C-methylase UbiE
MPESERPNPFLDAALASAYDGWFDVPLGRLVDTLEWSLIERLCQPQAGESALDVGTGTGHFALLLARCGLEVTGCDSSPAMLQVARGKAQGEVLVGSLQWQQGQAENLSYADGSFDLVLSVTALEFVQDRRRALDEMWRVTAPGGRMVVAVLNARGPWARFYRQQAQEIPFHYAHHYGPDEFLAALSGYGPLRWNSAVFFGPRGPGQHLAHTLERIGQRLGKRHGALLVGRVDK